MSTNIHLRGVDEKTMQAIKLQAMQQETSINSLLITLIKKGLGLERERQATVFHDLDKLAGTWTKKQADAFLDAITNFEQIDKDLWK